MGIMMAISKSIPNLPRIGGPLLAERTADVLLRAVLDGTFDSGKLPPEPELAELMGVSRTTIRAALHTLERLGVLSRTRGRGTTLRPHVGADCMVLHPLYGFQGLLEGEYTDVTVEELFTVESSPSTEAREALTVGSTTDVLVNRKTYFVTNVPAVDLVQEVPLECVPEEVVTSLLRDSGEFPTTITELSRRWPGRTIEHSIVEIVPQIWRSDLGDECRLRLAEGAAYLELRETHYTASNRPVAFARERVADNFLRLRLVRNA